MSLYDLLLYAESPEGDSQFEYSITIQRAGQDIDVDRILQPLDDWVHANTSSAFFATERGEKDGHLHFQGVIRTRRLSLHKAALCTKSLKAALELNAKGEYAGKGNVSSRALKNSKLHTFEGMIGYCMKDRGRDWYRPFEFNITPQMVEEGLQLYLQYGASEVAKAFIVLSQYSIFQKAAVFHKMYMHVEENHNFRAVLLEMHMSGKYAPDSKWIIQRQGQGMAVDCAEAAWKMMKSPKDSTMNMIEMVYFDMERSNAFADHAHMRYDRRTHNEPSSSRHQCEPLSSTFHTTRANIAEVPMVNGRVMVPSDYESDEESEEYEDGSM